MKAIKFFILLVALVSMNSCGTVFGVDDKQIILRIDGKVILFTRVYNWGREVQVWEDTLFVGNNPLSIKSNAELLEYRKCQADSLVSMLRASNR